MADVKQLEKALRSSIKTQESMLSTLKDIGQKSENVNAVSLRLLINYYKKYLDKLRKVLGD